MRKPICFLLLVPALVFAAAPTIDQSLEMHTPANPQISPDSTRVAFELSKTDWEENAFETEIWIASTAAPHNPLQLTAGKKSSGSPRWSPDGSQIAFTSDRDGKRQIYLIAPAGGEARQISKSETPVTSFRWSPDGKSIAYVAPDAESKAQKGRHDKYGDFEIVKTDHTMNHLWLLPLDGKAAAVTSGQDFSVGGFSWSPDGKKIAFAAASDPAPGSSGTSDLYVVDVASRAVNHLVSTKGPDRNPIWSPDGREIAFETANGVDFWMFMNSRLAVVPAAGGAPRVLNTTFDEDPQLLAWNGRGMFFEARERTASYLYRMEMPSGAIRRVGENDGFAYSQFSLSPDGSSAAFIRSTPTAFPEVFASETGSFRPTVLTTLGDQTHGLTLATREVVSWKSKDGATIEGILMKPADFDRTKKYPLLVVIHGGPTGIDQPVIRPDRNYPTELFVTKGALILRPNYRGSAGYGEKMRSLNVRNLGVGDAWDVLSGVDYLVTQGFVDPNRLGCMGWSQGGYISAFLTTSSDRFKAISVGAGISDWSTYYVNTDITPFTRQYLKGTPWDDPEIYRKTSPITYINNAKTPTLIQHGELDKRVPIPNGYELRQGLEDRGVPVKMIVYKGFGHGIDKPKQQRAVMEHNLEWFGKYIWGE
ncbi:MAG: peptidase prolyl oligopeptidase active site domain protein [Bryobacterales bacterium]|nr:peptidase prolyl oligopeptidase active site domain protein [Bryobacterales bacterium]